MLSLIRRAAPRRPQQQSAGWSLALLAANTGKPEHAKAITDEIAEAFPADPLPQPPTLGLSRALRS